MQDTKPGLETGKEKMGFPPTPPAPWSTAAAQPAQAHARPAARTRSRRPAALAACAHLARSLTAPFPPPPHHAWARRHVRRPTPRRSLLGPPVSSSTPNHEPPRSPRSCRSRFPCGRDMAIGALRTIPRYAGSRADVAPQSYPCACAPRRHEVAAPTRRSPVAQANRPWHDPEGHDSRDNMIEQKRSGEMSTREFMSLSWARHQR